VPDELQLAHGQYVVKLMEQSSLARAW
jgi:hypothetical protein